MATINKQTILNKKYLEKAFKLINKVIFIKIHKYFQQDNSGFITKEEMIKTFSWINVTQEKWRKTIEHIDLDKDDKVLLAFIIVN